MTNVCQHASIIHMTYIIIHIECSSTFNECVQGWRIHWLYRLEMLLAYRLVRIDLQSELVHQLSLMECIS